MGVTYYLGGCREIFQNPLITNNGLGYYLGGCHSFFLKKQLITNKESVEMSTLIL